MKRKIIYGLGAILIGALTIAAVGNGPYYALPAWAQKLVCDVSNCPRFIVLSDWANAAVLDRETGLVWERSPLAPCENPVLCSPAVDPGTRVWQAAQARCNQLSIGGRRGWHLPAIQDLASLTDPDVTTAPFLPPGHPFIGVQSSFLSFYWSATTVVGEACGVMPCSSAAWGLITEPFQGDIVNIFGKNEDSGFVWCVRGGQGGTAVI